MLLKDLYKTEVWKLASYLNEDEITIPKEIIEREPTAELHFEQKDTDDLGSYDELDKVLRLYLDEKLSRLEIIEKGYSKELVSKIISLLHKSEYKRFQAAPGIRLHKEAFGRDRRFPLTHHYNN